MICTILTPRMEAFVEHFYPVLADRDVFDTHLNAAQTAAVSEFLLIAGFAR